jgi:hypothetical protein
VSDPHDPLDPEEAEYAEEDLERQISGMSAPAVPNDRLTAAELREPRSLDDALLLDGGEEPKSDVHPVLVDHDVPDDEDELVAESAEDIEDLAPEELAMRITDEAPGATNDATDGYGDDPDVRE